MNSNNISDLRCVLGLNFCFDVDSVGKNFFVAGSSWLE